MKVRQYNNFILLEVSDKGLSLFKLVGSGVYSKIIFDHS